MQPCKNFETIYWVDNLRAQLRRFFLCQFLMIGSNNLSKLFQKFPQNIHDIIASPISILTLIGCILLLIVLVKAKKIEFTPQLISRIGIALALATILKMLRLYHFPQGGSITLGSMIPILLIAFMYGPQVGYLTGFLYGDTNIYSRPIYNASSSSII